jgi:hypothetical protein
MDDSITLVFSKTRSRCRRVFEQFFRVHALEVMDLIAEFWDPQVSSRYPEIRWRMKLILSAGFFP